MDIHNLGPADFQLEAALCKCPTSVHQRAHRNLVTHPAQAKNIPPTEARIQLPHLIWILSYRFVSGLTLVLTFRRQPHMHEDARVWSRRHPSHRHDQYAIQ